MYSTVDVGVWEEFGYVGFVDEVGGGELAFDCADEEGGAVVEGV